tara:strand:- start:123 stop:461 length:339 start_codon:yes stop_codon:yes gene_type:complete
MKLLLTALVATVLYACQPVHAQILYQKPVICGSMKALIPEWEKDGMYPLTGLLGGSPTKELGKYKDSYSVLLVNPEGKWAFFEYNGGKSCLLSGGFMVQYNSNEIKEFMGWE